MMKKTERTKEIIQVFKIKNGEELTKFYLKIDVILLADIFEKFNKVSIKEFDYNPLVCPSLPGYIWQCGF